MSQLKLLKDELCEKYSSDYMKDLIKTSPIFNDRNNMIYQKLERGYFNFASSKIKRLIEGRVGEMYFFNDSFFKKVFKYKGDRDINNLTNEYDSSFDYGAMDFVSSYGFNVDVKMIGPGTIIDGKFHSEEKHRETIFNKDQIDRYYNSSEHPFLFICSDEAIYGNEHEVFYDIKRGLQLWDKCDSAMPFHIDKATGREYKYRFNLEILNLENKRGHFLLSKEEFKNLVKRETGIEEF